jgi:hypothetical protein
MNGSWQTCKERHLKQTPLEALALSLAESDYSTKSTGLPVLLDVFRPLGHIAYLLDWQTQAATEMADTRQRLAPKLGAW